MFFHARANKTKTETRSALSTCNSNNNSSSKGSTIVKPEMPVYLCFWAKQTERKKEKQKEKKHELNRGWDELGRDLCNCDNVFAGFYFVFFMFILHAEKYGICCIRCNIFIVNCPVPVPSRSQCKYSNFIVVNIGNCKLKMTFCAFSALCLMFNAYAGCAISVPSVSSSSISSWFAFFLRSFVFFFCVVIRDERCC